MTERTVSASITRPNLGSLAYVWIGDKQYVAATTSEAHAILRKRGDVRFMHYSGRTEYYEIDVRGRS